MFVFLLIYLTFVITISLLISKAGRFYVFSPLVVIYITFAASDVVPILMYDSYKAIPSNVLFVTKWATIINIITLLYFYRDLKKEVVLKVPVRLKKYSSKRRNLLFFFVLILLLSGIYTGVTKSILSGVSVENLRRTSEIGLGFITMIPYFAVYLILLQILLSKKNISVISAAIYCLLLGGLLFFSNAARAQILMGATIFLIWFNLKHRALKWFEYFVLFFLISPVVATILYVFRSGLGSLNLNEILFAHQNMIFKMNTIQLMKVFDGTTNYLYGLSYYVPLTILIPRFLWADKPVSIDYYYKELAEMEFEGGGIYTTPSMDFYMNFGDFFVIPYILWILLIHYLYRVILNKRLSYIIRISAIYFLALFSTPGNLISKVQLFLLFMIISYFYYGKKYII